MIVLLYRAKAQKNSKRMSGIPPFFIPGVTPPNPWANAAMMAQAQQQAQQAQMAAAAQLQAQAAAQLQAAQIHAVQAAHAQVQAQVQATQGMNFYFS